MSEVRCAYAGCQLPRPVGQYLCADHRGRPKTLKESIAAGPKFLPVDGICVACGKSVAQAEPGTMVDRDTGLGPNCWRAWRFSTERKS